MKIFAIIGSPRTDGNTYKAVKRIENELRAKSSDIQIEYSQLSNVNLELCKGCYVCIARGEEYCPLRDDRESLEMKIKQSDAVIFATPVYTYNVSWIMKNFMDRFAYRCHRPDFYGKKAMVVVSTGAVGLTFVAWLMSATFASMGFIDCAKVCVTFAPAHEKNEKKTKKEMKNLSRKTQQFYQKLVDTKPVKPSFIRLLTFKKQKKGFANAPQGSADYKFWKEKGWLDKKANYYYDAPVGIVHKVLVHLLK